MSSKFAPDKYEVLRALPRAEDPLLLRLLGRDPVPSEATGELQELPTQHPMRAMAGPLLIRMTGAEVRALKWEGEEKTMRAETKKFMDDLRASLRE